MESWKVSLKVISLVILIFSFKNVTLNVTYIENCVPLSLVVIGTFLVLLVEIYFSLDIWWNWRTKWDKKRGSDYYERQRKYVIILAYIIGIALDILGIILILL